MYFVGSNNFRASNSLASSLTYTQSPARHTFSFCLACLFHIHSFIHSVNCFSKQSKAKQATWSTPALRLPNQWERPQTGRARRSGSPTPSPSPERAGPRKSTTSSSKLFSCESFFFFFSHLISLLFHADSILRLEFVWYLWFWLLLGFHCCPCGYFFFQSFFFLCFSCGICQYIYVNFGNLLLKISY